MSPPGKETAAHPPEVLSAEAIAARVTSLATDIAAANAGRNLHLLVVLRGAFVFAADLARELHGQGIEVTVDFCRVASYGDGTEPGVPAVELYHPETLTDRDVLIVEDIVDTGIALEALLKAVHSAGPRSVACAALLSKPSRRRVAIQADFTGFIVPDKFVVGYGLDYAGRYRHLPYVGALQERSERRQGSAGRGAPQGSATGRNARDRALLLTPPVMKMRQSRWRRTR